MLLGSRSGGKAICGGKAIFAQRGGNLIVTRGGKSILARGGKPVCFRGGQLIVALRPDPRVQQFGAYWLGSVAESEEGPGAGPTGEGADLVVGLGGGEGVETELSVGDGELRSLIEGRGGGRG